MGCTKKNDGVYQKKRWGAKECHHNKVCINTKSNSCELNSHELMRPKIKSYKKSA